MSRLNVRSRFCSRFFVAFTAALSLGLLEACSSGEAESGISDPIDQDLAGALSISPGRSVGRVRLGMTYAELKGILGPTQAFGANNVVFAPYPQHGLEIVFSSSQASSLDDDARVLSIGATEAATFAGPVRPGERRDAIEKRVGAGESTGDTVFYAQGLGVKYDKPSGADSIAKTVSVFAPYRIETIPPRMQPPSPGMSRREPLDLGGKSLGIVDMHLHPGFFGRIPIAAKSLFANSVPPFMKAHLPAVASHGLDPWAPDLGIHAQTMLAGVNHAVLFAVYTQKTTGFFSNEDLEEILTDPRNQAADGLPWAFGFASIDFDGYLKADGTVDEDRAASRLRALSGYLERRRDLFIGIKLAHAHQGVAFDDRRYLGVYDVAAQFGVPVYLHTGFTPFPGGQNKPAFYDPSNLENTITNYPSVKFVLGHVGQGDPAAVEHSLDLAARYPNVYLEISALNRPLLVDDDEHPVTPDPAKPQYPYVLEQVKARGLVSKTLFGTDGPQSAGMVRSYVSLIRQAMVDKGYSEAEVSAVMGKNFERIYFPNH